MRLRHLDSSGRVYRLVDGDPPLHADLVFLATRVPGAVAGLVTALDYYGLTEQVPMELNAGIRTGARRPRID